MCLNERTKGKRKSEIILSLFQCCRLCSNVSAFVAVFVPILFIIYLKVSHFKFCELVLLNCSAGEDSWESLGLKEIQPVNPGSSVHENSPGKNTGVGCHILLQRIFSTQGSNPGLLNCRQILYQLSYQGSPI